MSKDRDYEIGGRRGYVTSSPGRASRVVIERGDEDVSMSVREAQDLAALLGLLLREAGEWTPIWPIVLGHNLVTAGALAYATERMGSGRYCRACDEPTTRESWERTVDGCPARREGARR